MKRQIPSPYRHPLPIIHATAKRPPSGGMPLAALFAIRCVQIAACCLFGVALVAAAVLLRHFTR